MKFLLYIVATILFVFSIPAVAGVADYTEQEIQNMPRYSSIEQQRCPKAKYPSVKKRLECKKEVRVEIYEKHKNENVQTTDQKEQVSMGHGHHPHHHHCHPSEMGERRLWWAVGANVLLTLAQVVGGLISGSLSLVADALHNFSDAASLFIALVAVRIGRKPPDQFKTFGYKRAETIAALINLTTLIIIGVYLCYEAIMRFITPEPIAGWMIVIVAGIALIVDVFTAALTYSQSKNSMNMRAAFLHNVTDALASVGVIVAGALILLYGWIWTDAVMTLLISGYVLWHGFAELPKVIHLLMEGTPEHIKIQDVITAMERQDGIENVHHVHVWQIDEHKNALEAHVVFNPQFEIDDVKSKLKELLKQNFDIGHSTLEFEIKHCHT